MRHTLAVALLASLSACAGRAPEVAVVPTPSAPVVAPEPPALPAGASPGMAVPAMLADGSFPTPNRGLTAAATIWHLRAGLNVAALACRSDEATIVPAYNAYLAAHRAELAAAEAAYAAEFRAAGGDWRDRYDDAMTRLYNYYATPPAQPAFCAAATQALAGGPEPVTDRLKAIDRAFTDFYRAYDAWRAAQTPVLASAAAPGPRVRIDLAALSDDGLASPR